MQRTEKYRYWVFQLVGWGLFASLNIFFAFLFNKYTDILLQRLIFMVEVGLIFSHLMREVIRRSGLMIRTLQQQIIIFVILTIIFALLIASVVSPFEYICKLRVNQAGQSIPYKELLFTNI